MSDFVVEPRGLTKRFGEVVAVDDLTLRVRRGEVYGFLGPNGAGKTTALRMLLGLARPSSGEATVLDARPGSSRAVRRIGAMVKAPGLYPLPLGRDNLEVLARPPGTAWPGPAHRTAKASTPSRNSRWMPCPSSGAGSAPKGALRYQAWERPHSLAIRCVGHLTARWNSSRSR